MRGHAVGGTYTECTLSKNYRYYIKNNNTLLGNPNSVCQQFLNETVPEIYAPSSLTLFMALNMAILNLDYASALIGNKNGSRVGPHYYAREYYLAMNNF